jgi:xylulokinase
VVVVGIDLGTQSLKAVVCDERLGVLGSHAVGYGTSYPRPGWAEQDPRVWEGALAPAIAGALAAAGVKAGDVAGLAIVGQLDGCVAVDGSGAPLHAALIWQDRRAIAHVVDAPADRVFSVAGQIADASHLAPKTRWLREQGTRAARYHLPVSYLVERLTGEAVLDPGQASTTMLFDLAATTWSPELLTAFGVDAHALPRVAPATAVAGTLTSDGAALTGLPAGTTVAVGTGDDFAAPLGAGIVDSGPIVCVLGTAEVVGAVSSTLVIDTPAGRAASDPWRALPEPMVETHAYPTGAWFVENPGWLSGGAVRWAATLLGCASDAELDALATSAPPGADGVTFVPALAGAMTPQWRGHARGTLHGLTPAHGREHVARAVLEGLAFACRDVVGRLTGLGLPAREVVVLGGGGQSALWLQIRADVLGLRHAVAARTDTAAIGGAMLARAALGQLPDLRGAAAAMPAPTMMVTPGPARADSDAAYERYRRLVGQVAPLGDLAWA